MDPANIACYMEDLDKIVVNENIYSNISKQSFHSVHTLKSLLQQTSERKPLPASARSPEKTPATFKKHVTFVMDNNKVIRIDPEDYGTSMPKPICKKPVRPILKKPSAAPVCFHTAENPTTSSTLTRTSISAFSSKSTVKSAVVSRPLGRSQTVPPRKTFNAAGSTAASEVTCKPAPCSKMKNVPRCAEAIPKALVAPWIKTTSVATVKPRVEQKNTAASKLAHAKKTLEENTTVAVNLGINVPSAPHRTTATPEVKKPHKEPSNKSANKTALRGNVSKVGLNQLLIVSWEGKQQVYCLLCAARLRSSSHATSYNHCYNYVIMKYPGWTAKPSEIENKLNSAVAHLAEVERDAGFQSPQRMAVTKDIYQKLASLAEDTAIEMVKTMLRQKDPHVSSAKDEAVEAFREEAASPCQVSSSDGVSVVDDKVAAVLSDQMQQEHKAYQTQQRHFTGEDNAFEHRSVKSSEEDKSDQKPLHESICDKVHPDPVPSSQTEEIKEVILEKVQEDEINPDPKVNSMSEITHESSGTKVLKTLCKTEDPHSPVQISDAASPLLQEALESPLKPSLIQICSPPLETPASVTTGPQNSSGASYSMEQDAGLGEYSTSQAQPLKFFGAKAQGSSHLLFSLNLSRSLKSVIGMASVWECRGISQEMFYLCESCEEMLSHRDIFQHMVSLQHQLKCLWRRHPQFLQMFWVKEDLPTEFKTDLLNHVVQELAYRDRFHKVDARCVLLGQELYWFVRMTHFSEALKAVKVITNEEKRMALSLRISAIQQKGQQNDSLSIEEPLPTKSLLASRLNTKHRSDFETGQNITKADELMSVVEDLNMVRKREVLSPDGRSFSVKSKPHASPIPVHPNPRKTSRGSSPQPTLAPNLSRLQRSDPLPHVKRSESPSTTVSSAVTQNVEVSLTNESPGIRKRAAETSLETLLLSCTSSPLEHPLSAKCAPSPVTVKSEPIPPSASVYSTQTSTPLALKDGTSGPKQIPHTVDRTLFSELTSRLNMNYEIDFSLPSASDYSTTSSSCAAISPGNIKTRWDSRIVVIKSPTAVHKKKWDSKGQLVKATVKKNLPIYYVEGIKTKPLTTDSSSVSANISHQQLSGSHSAYSAAASVQSAPTAATADPKDPHSLRSSNAQDVGNVNIFTRSCVRTDQNPGQISQSSSVPCRSGTNQQSPSTITTAQPKPVNLTFQVSNHDVSKDHQVSQHAAKPNASGLCQRSGCTSQMHLEQTGSIVSRGSFR